jgi:hypothetical protein
MIYSTSAFTALTPALCSSMPCSPDAGRTTHANFTRSNSGQRQPFGCADKPAEKHCWLICCERKILFRLKKQTEKDGL